MDHITIPLSMVYPREVVAQHLLRIAKLPVEMVVNALAENRNLVIPFDIPVIIDITSSRMRTYLHQQQCAYTGVEIAYFCVERTRPRNYVPATVDGIPLVSEDRHASYHLNAYAVVEGVEVMMTSDHILPKSITGLNSSINRQPMLTWLNNKKGNRIFKQDLETADKRGIWDVAEMADKKYLRDELMANAENLPPNFNLVSVIKENIVYRIGQGVCLVGAQFPDGNYRNPIEDINGTIHNPSEVKVGGVWYPRSAIQP